MKTLLIMPGSGVKNLSPLYNPHYGDVVSTIRYLQQMVPGTTIQRLVKSWDIKDDYPYNMFLAEALRTEFHSALVTMHNLAKLLDYEATLLDKVPIIYYLLQDPRPQYRVWGTTLKHYRGKLIVLCPGTQVPKWAPSDIVGWVCMGNDNYHSLLAHTVPKPWFVTPDKWDISLLWPGVSEAKGIRSIMLDQMAPLLTYMGSNKPSFISHTYSHRTYNYYELQEAQRKSVGHLFLPTEYHNECGTWLTPRFWQCLLTGNHMLVPNNWSLAPLGSDISCYADAVDRLDSFRRSTAYRQNIRRLQYEFAMDLL